MTREEAKQFLVSGRKVRHDYYSDDEWLQYKHGSLVTEDGCKHGSFLDEFWTKYQKWDDGWHLVEEEPKEDFSKENEILFGQDVAPYNLPDEIDYSDYLTLEDDGNYIFHHDRNNISPVLCIDNFQSKELLKEVIEKYNAGANFTSMDDFLLNDARCTSDEREEIMEALYAHS